LSGSLAFASGDPACAKNPATLRKGPGNQFPISWKVAKFMPFLKMENKNGWVKVQDLDGEMHWIPSRELSSTLRCLVIKTTVAALHTEPSTTSPTSEIRTVDRYTPMKRLESSGEWLHVEDESGHQAWVHETNVWKPAKIQTVDF
jgi:uncharacterized protein YgiM (DUF1202 family)